MDMSEEDVTAFRQLLGQRIAETVGKFPTKAAAAECAGITAEQINKWIAGTVKVPVEGMLRLARGADVDFCWLCCGPRDVVAIRGGRVFQEAVLRDVLASLATVIASEGVTFAPDRFAELVFDLHDYVIQRRAQDGAEADLQGIAHFITLAARSRR